MSGIVLLENEASLSPVMCWVLIVRVVLVPDAVMTCRIIQRPVELCNFHIFDVD